MHDKTTSLQGSIHNNTIITGFQHVWLADAHECSDEGDTYITRDVDSGFECGYRCRIETGTHVWYGQKAGEDCKFVAKGNSDQNNNCYREKGEMCWDEDHWSDSGDGDDYTLYKIERRRK